MRGIHAGDERSLRDLNATITDLNLNVQLTADGLDVPTKRVDLGSFNVAVFEARNAVLADIESIREFDLGEPQSFAEFP